MRVRVIVASNRAASGVYSDTSGPILTAGFGELDCQVDEPVVVGDGPPVREALAAAVADGVDLVVTSGGTGLTSTDQTPEMTAAVLEREVPGVAETIRAYGLRSTPHAMLSRGRAGIAGRTFIVNLAGSTGAAKDGLAVLTPIAHHLVDQLGDGDH